MRNSPTISSCAKGVKSGSIYNMKENVVAKLPTPETSVTSSVPLLIPINESEFDSKFGDVLKEVMTSFVNKCIILHSNEFESAEIKKVLIQECNIKDNIICHDDFPNNTSRTDLESFLKQPKDKLGVFQASFMTGMDSCNVCLIISSSDTGESVRCCLTRAVSDLKIILRFSGKFTYSIHLENARVEPKHLKCKQTNKNVFAFKCSTCSIDMLCYDCSYGCHHGHSLQTFFCKVQKKCRCDQKLCNLKKKNKS